MLSDLGTGGWTYIKYDQDHDRPKISWALFRRVWEYARPYLLKVLGLLAIIFAITVPNSGMQVKGRPFHQVQRLMNRRLNKAIILY